MTRAINVEGAYSHALGQVVPHIGPELGVRQLICQQKREQGSDDGAGSIRNKTAKTIANQTITTQTGGKFSKFKGK